MFEPSANACPGQSAAVEPHPPTGHEALPPGRRLQTQRGAR